MALGVGRGMLTLCTQYSALTETMPTPPLELSARMPPNNAKVQLDATGKPRWCVHCAFVYVHHVAIAFCCSVRGQCMVWSGGRLNLSESYQD